jgi:glycosyltransferase involved in cell wall biosynthesis
VAATWASNRTTPRRRSAEQEPLNNGAKLRVFDDSARFGQIASLPEDLPEQSPTALLCLALVPAYNAAETIAPLVRELLRLWPHAVSGVKVLVVDDGSDDETAQRAQLAGATVLRHPRNRGKADALRTGFAEAARLGANAIVTVDADGQHLPTDAARLATYPASAETLLLGVRDLVTAKAPRANRFGNQVSNFFVSLYARRRFRDSQCGLRRYPLERVLSADVRTRGYAYETDLLLTAARNHWSIADLPIDVYYPPAGHGSSHYRQFKDSLHIVWRVAISPITIRPTQ